MLKTITYFLPNNSNEEQSFFENLSALLGQLSNVTTAVNEVIITPISPKESFPYTIFKKTNILSPEVVFQEYKEISLPLTNTNNVKPAKKLSLKELYDMIKNQIVRIDHTGINLPASNMSKDSWNNLIQDLSKVSNIYKYPTGEDWPFILPATEEEFNADITTFSMGREPKFELVYDKFSDVYSIQIDLETDLTRSELEKLLPEPYGISFPDLANFFRTVYIQNPWNLQFRFDLRFKNNEPGGDWETGKWLVQEGGRIKKKI